MVELIYGSHKTRLVATLSFATVKRKRNSHTAIVEDITCLLLKISDFFILSFWKTLKNSLNRSLSLNFDPEDLIIDLEPCILVLLRITIISGGISVDFEPFTPF